MSATVAIRARLGAVTAVTDLVGQRIEPEQANQYDHTYPRIVIFVENEDRVRTYSRASTTTSAKVTVVCLALKASTRDQLSKAVKDALDDQSGTWGGFRVQGCFLEEGEDVGTETDPNANVTVFASETPFLLWFNAA